MNNEFKIEKKTSSELKQDILILKKKAISIDSELVMISHEFVLKIYFLGLTTLVEIFSKVTFILAKNLEEDTCFYESQICFATDNPKSRSDDQVCDDKSRRNRS